MLTKKSLKIRIHCFFRRITGTETYKEEFLRKNKIKTDEDLRRYMQTHKPADLSIFTAPLPSKKP